ncbi:epimerase [Dermacoccaceae bacterium W4C1]
MARRVVIAGASGFIGEQLNAVYAAAGDQVARIGRSGPDATWDDPAAIARLIDGSDLLINLAGKSVGCRYTDANREEILRSRVETTRALREAVAGAAQPPRLWLNASTATIYRHATDRPQTEATGELGSGFSVDVATSWERELFAGECPDTRRVALRMAIVIGDGPAIEKLATAARFGLGGAQHDGWWPQHRRYRGIGAEPTAAARGGHPTRGMQRFSWIDIEDVVRSIQFIDDHDEISGPVNLAVPTDWDNRALMAGLRQAVGAKFGLPAYRWMLEPGMLMLRQESELVLKSRWVHPQVLTEAGFEFAQTDLNASLRAALTR